MNIQAASPTEVSASTDATDMVSLSANWGASGEATVSLTPVQSDYSTDVKIQLDQPVTEVQGVCGDSGYELTDSERIAVECAVMAEAGAECVEGQMMIAQCILDGALRNDISVITSIDRYQVASCGYSKVTDQVRESVSRVFDKGERVTEKKADLWYNPALTSSEWHEQQIYITTIGNHRFFWMTQDLV